VQPDLPEPLSGADQVLRRGGDKAALIMAGQPPHGRTMFVQALAAKLGIATGQSLATVAAIVVTAAVIGLNGVLLWLAVTA
jgi:hypothetical protein